MSREWKIYSYLDNGNFSKTKREIALDIDDDIENIQSVLSLLTSGGILQGDKKRKCRAKDTGSLNTPYSVRISGLSQSRIDKAVKELRAIKGRISTLKAKFDECIYNVYKSKDLKFRRKENINKTLNILQKQLFSEIEKLGGE